MHEQSSYFAHKTNNCFVTLLLSSSLLAALFTNMRILKFKSQPTIAFFAAVNHLNGPLRKQNFTLRVQKVMVCDWWISIRFVCFSVSRYVACDRNYDWWQRKTQLWRRLLNFRVRMFVKSAVRSLIFLVSLWSHSIEPWISWPMFFHFSVHVHPCHL